MIKFVFFDFANTLVYKPDVFKGFQKFVAVNFEKEIGLEKVKTAHDSARESIVFPDKTSETFYSDFNKSVLVELGIEGVSRGQLTELFQELKGLQWRAFSDTGILKDFALPKAILSNWDECLEQYVHELTPYEFEFIMGSFSIGLSKPDQKFYEAALNKLKNSYDLKPANILMVGDSPKLDIAPAEKLGMHAVLIDREAQFPNYAGLMITSLEELPDLIRKVDEGTLASSASIQ